MTVYVVAQIRVTNPAIYADYASRVLQTIQKHGGRRLAADPRPTVVEGEWNADQLGILAFDTDVEMLRWAQSDDYHAIVGGRQASTDGIALLVDGESPPAWPDYEHSRRTRSP